MYVTNGGLGERSPMPLDAWHLGESPRLAHAATLRMPARSRFMICSSRSAKRICSQDWTNTRRPEWRSEFFMQRDAMI
jgi:hypothetical protein